MVKSGHDLARITLKGSARYLVDIHCRYIFIHGYVLATKNRHDTLRDRMCMCRHQQ